MSGRPSLLIPEFIVNPYIAFFFHRLSFPILSIWLLILFITLAFSFFSLFKCRYEQSLSVLRHAKISKEGMITKSSIMLGLGESDDELKEAMADLRAIDVDILTLGQYLQVCWYTIVHSFLLWRLMHESWQWNLKLRVHKKWNLNNLTPAQVWACNIFGA